MTTHYIHSLRVVTSYDPPPIPVPFYDWTATTEDYEPGDLIGWGATEEEAVADLREQMG